MKNKTICLILSLSMGLINNTNTLAATSTAVLPIHSTNPGVKPTVNSPPTTFNNLVRGYILATGYIARSNRLNPPIAISNKAGDYTGKDQYVLGGNQINFDISMPSNGIQCDYNTKPNVMLTPLVIHSYNGNMNGAVELFALTQPAWDSAAKMYKVKVHLWVDCSQGNCGPNIAFQWLLICAPFAAYQTAPQPYVGIK